MNNQNNRNFTRENEDRFLFKKPAVPLFPAAAGSLARPGVSANDEKSNLMKQENMRPGQPFWKMLTQSDKSPLHSVNQGDDGPALGMGNNPNRGIGNDGGAPFRRNFRGVGDLPSFMPPRDDSSINPFLRDLLDRPIMEGSGNRSMPQTFDYNHGASEPGRPNVPPWPFMGPGDRPEGGRPGEPRPLMEVTIPNPAALFQKLHAKLDKKNELAAVKDRLQQGQRQSPRQRNDSQKKQSGPSNRQGDQGKQKGSPGKGASGQNDDGNRGMKRMAELQKQLVPSDQISKKRKTDSSANKKETDTKSMNSSLLEYDAESMKLMDAIAQGSQEHQLQLIKATGIKENFTGRSFIPWMCYICNTENWNWQAYITHCKSKDHKSKTIGLGTTLMKDEKTKLLNVLRKLPFTRVSFPIGTTGKTDQEDCTSKSSDSTSSSGSTPPVVGDGMRNKKGMFECKPCSRFFLQRDRMQSHMKSEGHQKREAFLKQRYGNSWLDYHWYNQARKQDRRDVEPQGIAFVLPVSGYFCKLCSRFYNSEITAKDVHCRQISHIDKVKEWDRQQLTKKEAIKLKLNAAEIETAVEKKERLANRINRWSRPKLSTNTSEVVVVDSDGEDGGDIKMKDGKEQNEFVANNKKVVTKRKDEELEEGELSEAEVLKMEKQQQEDRIKDEWLKREAKKREMEQREKEQKEKQRKEREAKERKEREDREQQREKERKEREAREQQREKERKEREAKERKEREEKMRKAKEEKVRRERERFEREQMIHKLQEEKRQLEQQKREFQEQVAREKKAKEEMERLEKEAKQKQETAKKLQEEQEKKLREARMREMLELETRIRQQEKRERNLLEERVQLGQMLAARTGTTDVAFIERDMRDKEIRGRVVREQLDKDIKQLEELRRLQLQLEQVAPEIRAKEEKDTRAKVEAEMKKAEEARLREERLREVEKREKELQEIEKREQERQKIEEKERELMEIEMRDKARREQELQERREQEMMAIRELERKARLEEEMQAQRQQQMHARHEQEMKARQEQEMQARHGMEMQARLQQEMKVRQEQEMKARQEMEMKARQEMEMQARQEREMETRHDMEMQAEQEQEIHARHEMEMHARREQEMQARQEQEMLRMREQEILARREQDIQEWQMREAQMAAEGVSEVEILQQRHVFQQQLEEKYAREALPLNDVARDARNFELEREMFLCELRQKARGELMMKAMQLQREGLTDAEIQEIMVREEEIMKERIFEEMQHRGFTDHGVPSGPVGGRDMDPASEQGMVFDGDERGQEDDRRDREWREDEVIERERHSIERDMRQRSPERDYDERDNVPYIEGTDDQSIKGVRNDTSRYDGDYPPGPDSYGEEDYYSDDGSYREGDFGDEYDSVQGNDEDDRLGGTNRHNIREMSPRSGSAPRQGRMPVQRQGERRRRRRNRGQRKRKGRGGVARRGR